MRHRGRVTGRAYGESVRDEPPTNDAEHGILTVTSAAACGLHLLSALFHRSIIRVEALVLHRWACSLPKSARAWLPRCKEKGGCRVRVWREKRGLYCNSKPTTANSSPLAPTPKKKEKNTKGDPKFETHKKKKIETEKKEDKKRKPVVWVYYKIESRHRGEGWR